MTVAAPPARVSDDEAIRLLIEAPLHEIGARADEARLARHPDGVVTYVVYRNVNYTNVCAAQCDFCAFKRDPGDEDSYLLDEETIAAKIREAKDLGATSVLLQGGLHPDLRLPYYVRLVSFLRNECGIHVHGFSAPAVQFLSMIERRPYGDIFEVLVEAGLGSFPGGGAEVLDEAWRARFARGKCTASEWIEVHRAAHRAGLRSTATLMFGAGEGPREVVAHLRRLRDLQDETGGFTAFIPWSCQPARTRMAHVEPATAVEFLRTLALARLVLDNFESIETSWVTNGMGVAQAGLRFGANDFGSLMIEENVVAATGIRHRTTLDEMRRVIAAAGFTPVERTILYERRD